MEIARKGIQAVLDDPESTTSERLKAIDLALKLTMVQKRIGDGDDNATGFFPDV